MLKQIKVFFFFHLILILLLCGLESSVREDATLFVFDGFGFQSKMHLCTQ